LPVGFGVVLVAALNPAFQVTGDSYAAQWVAGAWRKAGIGYFKSELPKSQIYLECLPLFARGLVRLPNHPRLTPVWDRLHPPHSVTLRLAEN
jgi:hypothetical protein